MDDSQLAALARQDGGRDALQALDDALPEPPWLMPDAPAQRDRIATALREADQPDDNCGTDGVPTTTAHIVENTFPWLHDSELSPIPARACPSEVSTASAPPPAATPPHRHAPPPRA